MSKGKAKKQEARDPLGRSVKALHEVPLIGREKERERLSRAIALSRLPQSMLFTGAEGVGKRRLAIWSAQALLCQSNASISGQDGNGSPCESCPSCIQVSKLSHPDLHIFVPHDSPGESSSDSQIAHIDKVRFERMERMRADALFQGKEGGGSYYAASARAVASQVKNRPVSGNRKVILVLDAERLLPYEGATEASNALLKLLEEPSQGTHFILTAPSRHTLLPTIASRTTELRLSPLSAAEMESIVAAARPDADVRDADLQQAFRQAQGSVSRLRECLDPRWQEQRARALGILSAALSGSASARYDIISEQGFKGARGEFSELLSHLEALSLQAAELLSRGRVMVPSSDPNLVRLLARQQKGSAALEPASWTLLLSRVLSARNQAAGNAGPMLVLHRVLSDFSRILSEASRLEQEVSVENAAYSTQHVPPR